jgi:hypothetical protein
MANILERIIHAPTRTGRIRQKSYEILADLLDGYLCGLKPKTKEDRDIQEYLDNLYHKFYGRSGKT